MRAALLYPARFGVYHAATEPTSLSARQSINKKSELGEDDYMNKSTPRSMPWIVFIDIRCLVAVKNSHLLR